MGETLVCSSEGCDRAAVEMLIMRGQYGHVHDCPEHAHDLREWCDVIDSAAIVDNVCPAPACTGNVAVWTWMPKPLDGRP